jgi:hypothetical protein
MRSGRDRFSGRRISRRVSVPSHRSRWKIRATITIVASFAIEDFALGRIATTTLDDVEGRIGQFRNMVNL